MTSSIFKSTQLKATLLGSFRARGGRPDPAKLLKAILMCKEQNKEVFLEKKKESEKLEKLTIRLSKDKKETIKKMVEKSSYNSISELARAGIDKELNVAMYRESLDFIVKELDRMLDEKLKPFIASQRKINAKYLRTTVINTYLNGEIMSKLFGDDMHKDFIQMLNDARKKANYYISRDTEGMTKKDLFDFYTIGEPYRNE